VPEPGATPRETLEAIILPLHTLYFPVLYPGTSPLNFTLPPGSYSADIDAVNGGVVEFIDVNDAGGKAEPHVRVSRKGNGKQLIPPPLTPSEPR